MGEHIQTHQLRSSLKKPTTQKKNKTKKEDRSEKVWWEKETASTLNMLRFFHKHTTKEETDCGEKRRKEKTNHFYQGREKRRRLWRWEWGKPSEATQNQMGIESREIIIILGGENIVNISTMGIFTFNQRQYYDIAFKRFKKKSQQDWAVSKRLNWIATYQKEDRYESHNTKLMVIILTIL